MSGLIQKNVLDSVLGFKKACYVQYKLITQGGGYKHTYLLSLKLKKSCNLLNRNSICGKAYA